MANVTIAGATYSDVPAIQVPQAGGGTVTFYENGGGGGTKTKTGKYTPSETYNTTGNRLICTTTDIGFTPSRFILELDDKANVPVTQYAVLYASYEEMGDAKSPIRITGRWSSSGGNTQAACSLSSWTNQTNYFMYKNGTSIYFRTTSAYILVKDVTYKWTAYE